MTSLSLSHKFYGKQLLKKRIQLRYIVKNGRILFMHHKNKGLKQPMAIFKKGEIKKHLSVTTTSPKICHRKMVAYNSTYDDSPLFRQLSSELTVLDGTLEELQTKLQSNQNIEDSDTLFLTNLIAEVKKEQQAWLEEVEAMDKLMQHTAELESSETELDALRRRYDNMKRKVELFTGLLREREREVDSLRAQLEDVKQVGELKERKKNLKRELIFAGEMNSERKQEKWSKKINGVKNQYKESFNKGEKVRSHHQNFDMDEYDSVEMDDSHEMDDETIGEKQLPEWQKSIKDKRYRITFPGVVLASGAILTTRVLKRLFGLAMNKLPREIKAMVEIIGLFIIAYAIASLMYNGLWH